MKLIFSLLICLLAITFTSFAQHVHTEQCATVEVNKNLQKKFPNMGTDADFEEWIAIHIKKLDQQRGQIAPIYTIPVVVHVIHDGDMVGVGENLPQAQILSQIDVLNEDFQRLNADTVNTPAAFLPFAADCQIEFCMALYDPSGSLLPEPGINRVDGGQVNWDNNDIENTLKPQTIWDPNQYFNVWTMRFSNNGLLGYAQFPQASGLPGLGGGGGNAANTDGITCAFDAFGTVGALRANYGRGRTTTHEAGHFFGLRHVWGDGDCNADDFCDDTPNQDNNSTGCVTTRNTCVDNPIDYNDMVQNYMDYSVDACSNLFTEDQKARMMAVMMNSPRRGSLANSTVCTPINQAPVAGINVSVDNICPGDSVQFFDVSSSLPNQWLWTFPGGTPATSTLKNPWVTYDLPGTYNAKLVATNSIGADSITSAAIINVFGGGGGIVFEDDFESNSFTTKGWTINDLDGDMATWELATVAGNAPGSNAASVLHFTYAPGTGQRDELVTPVLDFTNTVNTKLEFEYAHRRRAQGVRDSLIISVSNNGGTTYTDIFIGAETGGGVWATGFFNAGSFIPQLTSDWCFDGSNGGVDECFTIDLSAFDGDNNVRVKFTSVNDNGNNIYLDNIVIGDGCGALVNIPPQVGFDSDFSSNCAPVTVSFRDKSLGLPTEWSWIFPGGQPSTSVQPNPTITYYTPGVYDVILEVTNINGTNTDTFEAHVSVGDRSYMEIGINRGYVCENGTLQLSSGVGSTYSWSPTANLNAANVQNPIYNAGATGLQTIYLNGIDTAGCIVNDSVIIEVVDCENLVIPNAFSPNNDGVNDTWNIKAAGFLFPDNSISIFNRWGQEVFNYNGYTNEWDGTNRGERLPDGTYYYVLDFNDGSDKKAGNVTILR